MSKRFLGSVFFAVTFTMLLLAAGLALISSSTQAQAMLTAPSYQTNGQSLSPDAAWTDVAPFPTVTIDFTPSPQSLKLKRSGAAGFPSNNKLYVLGGRHGIDGEDTTERRIWEYTPGSPGSWTQKTSLLDASAVGSRFTANMAVAVLTDSANNVRIYAIGGNSIDSQITGTVRMYSPITDSLTTLTSADTWPASPARIPGGYAVVNNQLYIFGGFSALGSGRIFTDTWRFNPAAPVGSKWTQLASANLNLGRGFIAGAALDGMIYAIGGDTWDSVNRNLIAVTNVERLDPSQANPTWTNVASLPLPRGDMGSWAYNTGTGFEISGKIVVAGGLYPNADSSASLYDPIANSWSTFAQLNHPTRNFGAAQLNGFLYAFGGYDFSNRLPSGANFNQRYDANLAGPTSTPTISPTRTNTHTPTITPTPTTPPNGYAYFSPSGPITVSVGTKFSFDLMVNAGSNSVSVAQNYLTFTNSLLQLVDNGQTGCVITSVVTPDMTTFDSVLQNETCNGPGSCVFRGTTTLPGSMAFAAGALSSCPSGCTGTFRIAQVAWCGTSTGDAIIHWQFSPPAPPERDTQIVDSNGNVVSNRTLYGDVVVHIVPPSATQLRGHITMQGRPAQPSPLQSVPVTLTLRLTSGGPDSNYSTTTDASGYFTVTAPGAGSYNWRAKNPQTLANSGSTTLVVGNNTQEMGTLRTGDANDDNCVNVQDFSILKNTFGKSVGDPGYDGRADFNGDNVVNSSDFTLQKGNFGQCGAAPILIGNR